MDMDGVDRTIRQLERKQLIKKIKEQDELIANILREREEDQGVIRVWRGRTERAEAQIEDLLTIKDDFCKCFDLAMRLDSQNPEQPGSFTGTVSERLVRSVAALGARNTDLEDALSDLLSTIPDYKGDDQKVAIKQAHKLLYPQKD